MKQTLKTLGTLFIGAIGATIGIYIILGLTSILFKLPYN